MAARYIRTKWNPSKIVQVVVALGCSPLPVSTLIDFPTRFGPVEISTAIMIRIVAALLLWCPGEQAFVTATLKVVACIFISIVATVRCTLRATQPSAIS